MTPWSSRRYWTGPPPARNWCLRASGAAGHRRNSGISRCGWSNSRAPAIAFCAALSLPAQAQQIVDKVPLPDFLRPALEQPGQIIDGVTAWPVDWSDAAEPDLLVQTGYAYEGGGNAVVLSWRMITPTPQGWAVGAPFDIPGAGIAQVQTTPQGITLVVYQYQANDPRCCPSGRMAVALARPVP